MGSDTNGSLITAVAVRGTLILPALNAILLGQIFGVPIRGLPAS
jgi:hypothetical protein